LRLIATVGLPSTFWIRTVVVCNGSCTQKILISFRQMFRLTISS